MTDSKYRPNPANRNMANQTITSAAWAEYREVFGNQLDWLITRYVTATYKKASQRQKIRVVYLPVMSYILDVASGALDLPFRISGGEKFQALARTWRPTLARAWKARYAAGSSYLHLASRAGQLDLDLLWGDSLQIEVDPVSPRRWDLIRSATIPTGPEGETRLKYTRLADGGYEMATESNGLKEPIGLLPCLPIVPMYKTAPDNLQPLPDRTILDLQITTGLQLSDIEFRRVYRTNQMWRKSDMSEVNKAKGGSDIEASPDAVIELGAGDSIGLIESSMNPQVDLQYIREFLQMASKTMKLPPEIFETHSRSETGAARAWDFAPLLELQASDRAGADEWLGTFLQAIRSLLEQSGVVAKGEALEVRTVPPRLPLPADLVQYSQGVQNMMALGLTSPVREVAVREGVGYAEAEKIVRFNLKQSKIVKAGNKEPIDNG